MEEEIAGWVAANGPHPRLLQWRALLLRALNRRAEALPLLHQAAAIAPDDFGIAHSLAQVSLEAGEAAMKLFEAALVRNPASTEVRLGLISARFAEGQGEQALFELARALESNPGWYAGHRQYAQLSAMLGRNTGALDPLYRTIDAFPDALDPCPELVQFAFQSFITSIEMSDLFNDGRPFRCQAGQHEGGAGPQVGGRHYGTG